MKAKQALIVLLVLCIVLSASSCEIAPNVVSIRLEMGQLFDLSEEIGGNFVASTQSDIVSVLGGTVLRGEKKGETTVTITKGLSQREISVSVEYAPPELTVTCADPFVTEKGSILQFVASVGLNADPNTEISWYVDGKMSGVGKTFDFAVPDYGKYEISAESVGQRKSIFAACFEPSELPEAKVSGESFVSGEEVELEVDCDSTAVVEWFVGEGSVGFGAKLTFEAERSGDYTVFALINGEETNEVRFSVYGTPQNVVCDFDSSYPNVFLRWDGADTEYEVTVDDVKYDASSPRMGKGCFDLSGLVDLERQSKLSLRAARYGEKVELLSPKLNKTELEFLNKTFLCGNYYMTSDEEVFDIVDYAMTFRPENGKIKLELKMGYDSELSPALLISSAWLRTEQTGIYKFEANGSSKKGGTLNFEIECVTGNEPTKFDTTGKERPEALCIPHFEGGEQRTLPIENRPKCEVASSEQLVYAVSNGFCPVPTNEELATLYQTAKETLYKITTDEMSDEQKVRAIFEWIMWNINYDYVASNGTDIYSSVLEPAYYLEGVFVSRFAVCDGIAKAMSVMCNMLDIPCVRVVGIVTRNAVARHAWNKVCLGGRWYLLDATWSDALISMNNTSYEGGTHMYYLLSDAEASDHIPAYDEHVSNFGYDYYGKVGRKVEKADFDALSETLHRARQEAVFEVKIGDEVTSRDRYCIELKIDKSVENLCKADLRSFMEMLNGLDGYVSHCFIEGFLFVTVISSSGD